MFSRKSRYKNLEVVIGRDLHGHAVETTAIRLLPQVQGTFHHVVEEGQRLDHLGYKYYRQPQKWWRVCDANPQFLSPLEMMSAEPVRTTLFTIAGSNQNTPPLYTLFNTLSKTVGVKEVCLENENPLVVSVKYNKLNFKHGGLEKIFTGKGFSVQSSKSISRTGKKIVIPPDTLE
ncbi:MAG: hypothetical protein GY757_62420 [bacterium]|nr:hypothetical protein [bacterium]